MLNTTDQLSSAACEQSSPESSTKFQLLKEKPKARRKVNILTVNKSSESAADMSKRKDFISDSSSDDELPVMDSLRARLAKKRQNAIASPFLPEHTSQQTRKTIPSNLHTILDIGVNSPDADTVSDVKDGVESPPDFSDSSGDEDEQQPLSSFLSSPSHEQQPLSSFLSSPSHEQQPLSSFLSSPSHKTNSMTTCVSGLKKPDSDSDLSVRSMDLPKCGSTSCKRPVSNQNTDIKLSETEGSDQAITVKPPDAKVRKKRTTEEIEENKRKAQVITLKTLIFRHL